MSTLKVDKVQAATDNTDLTLQGSGTGTVAFAAGTSLINANVTGNLSVTRGIAVGYTDGKVPPANLSVNGNVYISGATTVSDATIIKGAATLLSTADITGKLTSSSVTPAFYGANVTGNVSVTRNLAVGWTDGKIPPANLSVSGNTHISGITTFGSTLRIEGGSPGADKVLTSDADGDATWVAAGGGGAWTLIGTSTASSSASLTQTGLDSTYDTYAIICSNITMDDSGARLRFRVGDSGGIDSGASDYKYIGWQQVSSSTSTMEGFANTTSYIQLGPNNGISTVAHMICYLTIGNTPLLTASILLNDGNARATTLMGYRDSAITLTQVQILPSTSTIASGRLTVWGIKYT